MQKEMKVLAWTIMLTSAFLWCLVAASVVIYDDAELQEIGTAMTWPRNPEPKPPPCDPCQQCPPGCHKFCRDNSNPCEDWYCAC